MRVTTPDAEATPWRCVAAAAGAVLVGIGLARFAYAPIIPALIAAGWFTPATAAYLGAANLLGYLLGAMFGRRAAATAGVRPVLRGMMALASISLLACAVRGSLAWFFIWRLSSGVAGGALMVLAAPLVLPHVPPHNRGLASGLIFTGVGLGIAASATLVPALLAIGLPETWIGLGLLSLLLTAAAWRSWPEPGRFQISMPSSREVPPRIRALAVSYGLCAVGLVPHMVFLVDYVARGLGRGIHSGALEWAAFGAGALAGPTLAGRLADRIGFARSFRAVLAAEAASILLLMAWSDPVVIGGSALIAGASVPGIVAVTLGRAHELAGTDGPLRQAGWVHCTISFALGQAAAAYGMAFAFAQTESYAVILSIALAAVSGALLLELGAAVRAARADPA